MSERLICASQELVDGGKGVRCEVADPLWSSAGGADKAAPAFLIRFRGKVYGYLNRCGHVPVELDWQHGEFFDHSGLYLICATHGAMYAPETGRCMGGKCSGRGLRPLTVIERDGQVFLIEEATKEGAGSGG